MKKILSIGFGIAVFAVSMLIGSCKNYVDELSLAGFNYELKKVESSEGLDCSSYLTNPFESTISFGKDGSTVNYTLDADSYKSGKYSVNQTTKIINLDFGDTKFDFTYTDNGGKLSRTVDQINADYPLKDGPYVLIYKLK